MTPSIHESLSESTVAKIQDLIRVNIDSHLGFETVSECVEHLDTKLLLLDMAFERKRFADELQTLVAFNDEDPVDDGSVVAHMHRWWIELKGMVTSGSRASMLEEALRGEDKIKARYEEVTPEVAGSPAYDLVLNHLVSIRTTHARLKTLANTAS